MGDPMPLIFTCTQCKMKFDGSIELLDHECLRAILNNDDRTQAAKCADSNPVMHFLAIPKGDEVAVLSEYPYTLRFPDKSIVMYDGDDANPVCYIPGSTL